ncbi:hypothetical protein N9V47_09175 [Luminiphilus sp.]|jgi:hypothetical protein|nr:hypothetical protein [Luminiphilus sp.]MDA8591110.1 hypothetical protein [Luminiphilus sp.]MDA8739208.1 hypothetical protein [Luminiphilus sp.]MDB2313807.1 hypothetical protein [Luminiphilus sp.]MDB2377405.1 hypothetical protein [Luminiphilus sp.]
MPLEVLWGMDLSPYYHFALAVICLLTVYIPIFWAAGEVRNSSPRTKQFLIAFVPFGCLVMLWIEYSGMDWGRIFSNIGIAALSSLFLALFYKFKKL